MRSERTRPADLSDEQLDQAAGGMIFVRIPGMGDNSASDGSGGVVDLTPKDTGLSTGAIAPSANGMKIRTTLQVG